MDQSPYGPTPYGPAPGRRWLLAAVVALVVLALAAAGLLLVGAARANDTAPSALGPALAVGPGGLRPALIQGRGGKLRLGRGGAAGTLTAIDSSSLTVRGFGGRTVTVTTGASTAYYRDSTKVSRSELKVGDRVRIHLADPLASSPVAGAVQVVFPTVAGTVSEAQAGSFTLTDRVGFRHVIKTSGSTSYTKDRQSAGRSDVVTNGAIVRVVGTIDSNGTDMTASRVEAFTRVRQPGKLRRPFS